MTSPTTTLVPLGQVAVTADGADGADANVAFRWGALGLWRRCGAVAVSLGPFRPP